MSEVKSNVFKQAGLSHTTCQFNSKDVEHQFLLSKFKQDKTMTQFFLVVIASTLLGLVAVGDKLIIQERFWPEIAISWRVGFSLFCLGFAWLIYQIKTVDGLKKAIFLFELILIVNMQSMVFLYDHSYVLHICFDLIILMVMFYSILLPLAASITIGIIYALLGIIVIVTSKDITSHTLMVVVSSYLAVFAVGSYINWRENLIKRLFFYKNEHLSIVASEMKDQAYKDPLTKIANRRAFDEQFAFYKRQKNVCFVLADIDFFKRVNDTFGHEIGDKVLVQFSALLRDSVRPTDGVFRFGGEEFVLVLLSCDLDNAVNKVKDIVFKLNNNGIDIAEIDYPITSSFGVAELSINDDKESVIARADQALYRAKENGRNRLELAA